MELHSEQQTTRQIGIGGYYSKYNPPSKHKPLPDCDVENVGAHGGGDGHVAFALFGHQNTGNEIGHGGTGRQEGKSHHLKSISVPYQVLKELSV